MSIQFYIALFNVFLCTGLAFFVFWEDKRSLIHSLFALGMTALAMKQLFGGLAVNSSLPMEVILWKKNELTAASFLPGSWLLFSLIFGRPHYKNFIKKWQWPIAISVAAPILPVIFFRGALLETPVQGGDEHLSIIPLGWSGYTFHLLYFLSSVMIVTNLEETLRASTGIKRWQIKFIVLGLGAIFAVQLYIISNALLFSSINLEMESISSFTLLVANILILFSLFRSRFLTVDIYFSQTFLFNSITILVVGIYLVTVGVLAKIIRYLDWNRTVPVGTIFVFAALLWLCVVLLSDHLREKLRRFVNRHFHQPRYDYRKEWIAFTKETTSLVKIGDFCSAVSKMVSQTFRIPSVTIWLVGEGPSLISLGGSTIFSDTNVLNLKENEKIWKELLDSISKQPARLDFNLWVDEKIKEWKGSHLEYCKEIRIDHIVPLISGQQSLGFMVFSDRLSKEPFSVEDTDLLKTIGNQAASSLLNLKLSERLVKAKEMEVFQNLSAFFIHDLKNLASMLSLTMRNLPEHFEDPEFRTDALRVISQSVTKMNDMCARLSLLTKVLEMRPVEIDLNEFVASTLDGMNGMVKTKISRVFKPLPKCNFDPDQIQKVIVNLILNANEATGKNGLIHVETGQANESVVLSVSDNGTGMSKEFLTKSLFQPFQTTKSQGLGIGLFHTKKIIDAHRGKIEVESEEGVGTTFRIILPIDEGKNGTKQKK